MLKIGHILLISVKKMLKAVNLMLISGGKYFFKYNAENRSQMPI